MDNRSRRLELHLVLIVLMGIMLGGCAQPTESPVTETELPTASATPTATLTPEPTATLVPTITLAPPLPTPEATHQLTHAIIDHVFFGGSSPDCQLPCWNGLEIGRSSSAEVIEDFDRVFNFGVY